MRISQGAQMIATGDDDVVLANAKNDEAVAVVDRITHWRLPARTRGRREKETLNLKQSLQNHRHAGDRQTSRKRVPMQNHNTDSTTSLARTSRGVKNISWRQHFLATETAFADGNAGNTNTAIRRSSEGP
jgi:hypothetical protein